MTERDRLPEPTAAEAPPRAFTAVQALIAASVAVLFVQWTVVSTEFTTSALGFTATRVDRWWTFLTYSFVHGGALHVAANMYALKLFGPRLEQEWGSRRFAWFYFGCAIAGLLCHAVFVRDGTPLVGASAAVFGVMTAHAMQWPDEELHLFGALPLRVWTMVMLFVGVNLVMGVASVTGDASAKLAYFAHLGGAIAAWVYMRTPGSSSLEQFRQRVSRAPDVEDPPRAIPKSHPRKDRMDEVDEIVARSKAIATKRAPRLNASRRGQPKSDELNRVLDKISAEGLDSLTPDERRVLEEMSKRLNGG